MRKLIVISFISVDGIMQAPGGLEEQMSAIFLWTWPAIPDVLQNYKKTVHGRNGAGGGI